MSRSRYIADFVVSSNDIANSTITYVDIGTVFTSNIIENGDTTSGNLYFTNARVDARIATTSINALFDVDVTGVSTNQTLIWDGTKWTPGSPIVGSTGFSENANIANIVLSLSNLTTSNLNEGTNLYFTNARVFANVSGLLSAKVNTADLTTDNVRELSNLYFTNARVDARIATTSVNAFVDVDITGITTNQVLVWDGSKFTPTTIATSSFANVSNLANLVLSLENFTTSNLAEGSNLYYTNTRVYSNVVNTLQFYDGNIRAGNVIVTGKFVGDGSGITGLGSSALSGMATYGGNILASNITASSVTATNVYANSFISTGTGTPTLQSGTNINLTANNAVVITNSVLRIRSYSDTDRNANIIPQSGDVIFNNTSNVLQYYANGQWISSGNASALISALTTSNVNEGSNLYFTNARVLSGVTTGNISNLTVSGNVLAGNVIANRIYGTYFGDGSGLTGISAGGSSTANFANTSNLANLVLSLSNLTTSNLAEGSNLYYTNARVTAIVVSANISNITITGNLLAGNVIASRIYGTYFGDGSQLSGISSSANLSSLATYNGNILASNITAQTIVASNITVGNVLGTTGGSLIAGAQNNTVILGGIFRSTFDDVGNVTLPNVVIQGKIFGDGSALTGITTDLSGLATYKGNILAANITANSISATTILSSTGNISALTGSNTVIFGGLYASTFADNGNVTLPNVVVQGKIHGDGSGITGLSLASFNIATYTGNISATNVTVTQFVVTPTIYLGSNSQANNRITATTSDNTTIRHGLYTTQFLVGGNVITTGKFVGDGSGLTGVVGSSNLTTLPVYTGNILASNITVTNFLVTPNLILGNSSVSNSRITFTNSDNTAIRHGIYTTQFLTNGNVVSTGKFVGDGSGLTGITTSLTGMATYGGNILAANVTATNLNTTNLYVSNIINSTGTTVLSVTVSNNTSIRAGAYTSQFLDNGNVLLPNVVVSGKFYGDGSGITGITVSLSGLATYGGNILAANITANSISAGAILSSAGNISSIPGQNTIIFGGIYASTFSDNGNVTLPNVTIQGTITGNGSGLTGISLSSLNLPTYGGNILATNVTTTFLTTNTLIASFGNISALGGANTVIFGGSFASTFADNGNVTVPNIVVQGKLFGDGSGLTGISLASLNLATYTGNISAANITATQFIVTPNLYLGSNSQSNARITSTNSDNTIIRQGIYNTQFLINGNVVTTGKFVGDGSGLTGISTSSLNLPTYGGNILVANLFASQFIVTPNLIIGNTSVSNSRITFNTSDNTSVRHGIYTTQFLTNGNLVTTGKFVGDGSGLTGVLTSIGSIATYGGNILANNVTANIVYTSSLVGRTGNANISLLAGDNTVIFGGLYSSTFRDDGNVYLPNLIVATRASGLWVGNVNSANVVATSITASVISFGTSANLSSRNDNNTVISTGSYNTTFRDSGTIETTNVWVSTGLYVGSQALNNIISTSSRGSGTTTTYIGNQSITTSSDLRLKNILGNTTVDAVNVVSNLRVVDFTWNDPSDTSFNNKNARGQWTGLVAQEVINIVPYVVNAVRDQETLQPVPNAKNDQGKDIYWGMEYDKLVPLLIKAVQQQQTMIDNLNARILVLESNK